ncbi:hypothetical protein GCM10007973_18350 [Polymorphobacter multimanifer]|uniref:Uncharacterized protein n=1 Tax=Polymorphobacter multimanifer TaxID=1070431 RepID=A0A841L5Y7_9SPHN|nr:hypothetical protein [Polymorphobacter multimanifer]MBB6228349.1 hypothetical protein [Polymorphobacter multimanifer]GGI82221.1 hypothetical protein GCM10007973_18350 [Polymorphobacter multimanifer]
MAKQPTAKPAADLIEARVLVAGYGWDVGELALLTPSEAASLEGCVDHHPAAVAFAKAQLAQEG